MNTKAFLVGMGVKKRERNVRGTEEQKINFTYLILPCMHAQLCLALCCPIDCSLPDPFVHGISKQMILDAWGWCTGMTQRDGRGREEGGAFRVGNTYIPVADSC